MRTISTVELLDLFSKFIKACNERFPELEWILQGFTPNRKRAEILIGTYVDLTDHRVVRATVYHPYPQEVKPAVPGERWYIQWDLNMEKWLGTQPELKAILEPHWTGTFKL